MTDIKFTLQENDFLQLNLYYFKSQGKLSKAILKTWIAYCIIIGLLVVYLIWTKDTTMAVFLIITSAIISLFHKRRMKNVYLKKINKSIKVYESRFNKETELKVTDSELHVKSDAGNTSLSLHQIESISETADYFFIKLKTEAIVIPKLQMEYPDTIATELKKLAEGLAVPFHKDLNWQW